MSIETICDSCGQRLRVADEHAGKKARCPQCGLIYVVPGVRADVPSGERETIYQPRATDDEDLQKESLRQDTDNQWQVRTPDGRVYGPVDTAELEEWVAEGRVPHNAQLLSDRGQAWCPASEIYPQLMPAADVQVASTARANPFRENAYEVSISGPSHTYRRPHRGALILIMAILGWAMCPVFAPFAWSMGYSDMRAMRAGTMDPRGESLTQAGMILGLIETLFLILILGFMCLGSL